MQQPSTNLIEAIDKERTKRRLSDRKFSMQVLGISPAYWCRLKNGERAMTLDLLRLFMQKLPEITPEVTIFIMRQGNDGENQKTTAQTEGETPPGLLGTRKGSKHPTKT